MILMLCVDDNYGLAFNGRRQSRDREVLEDMLRLSGKCRIWMAPESAALFALPELTAVLETNGFPSDKLQVDKNFLKQAKAGEYCFAEKFDSTEETIRERVEELILYHWNRTYPADMHLQWDFTDYSLEDTVEFSGYSHEKITRERYVKGMKE